MAPSIATVPAIAGDGEHIGEKPAIRGETQAKRPGGRVDAVQVIVVDEEDVSPVWHPLEQKCGREATGEAHPDTSPPRTVHVGDHEIADGVPLRPVVWIRFLSRAVQECDARSVG